MNIQIKEYRARARSSLKGYLSLAIVAFFVANALSLAQTVFENFISIFGAEGVGIEVISTILFAAALLISGPLAVGLAKLSLKIVRKDSPEFGVLFSQFKSNFIFCILLYILKTVFIVFWSFLFVIPGIVAYYRYRFAEYIMADNPDISPTDAINLSKEMTYGRKGKMLLLDLSFIGWWVLSIFTLGIGSFFLTPYIGISQAEFYEQAKAEYYSQKNNANIETKKCPNCMNLTDVSAKFCPVCGYHFDNSEAQNDSNKADTDGSSNGDDKNNDDSGRGDI